VCFDVVGALMIALAMVVWTGLMFYLTIQYDRWCDRDDFNQ